MLNANKARVATATASVLNAIQDFRPWEQLLAITCAFAILLEATKLKPQDVRTPAINLMKDEKHSSRRDHRFAALRYYLDEEVLEKGGF